MALDSIVVALVYIPTNRVEDFLVSLSLASFIICFLDGHSLWGTMNSVLLLEYQELN